MKIKNFPAFDGELYKATKFALYVPKSKTFVNMCPSNYVTATSDPTLTVNENLLGGWQLKAKMLGVETEILKLEITVEKKEHPKNLEVLQHLLNISNYFAKDLTYKPSNPIDGAKLFQYLNKSHARYLVFYLANRDFNLSHKNDNNAQIAYIKKIVGSKIKCLMLDLVTKVSSDAIFFFTEDIKSTALLKLIGDGIMEIYDTKEGKFL